MPATCRAVHYREVRPDASSRRTEWRAVTCTRGLGHDGQHRHRGKEWR